MVSGGVRCVVPKLKAAVRDRDDGLLRTLLPSLLLSFVELVEINDLLRKGGWALKGADDIVHIEVDPDRLSGHPTIKDRRNSCGERLPGWRHSQMGDRYLCRSMTCAGLRSTMLCVWYQRVQDFEQAA